MTDGEPDDPRHVSWEELRDHTRDVLVRVGAGRRRGRSGALAEEARRIASDPADAAEQRAVMEDMDAVAADWPK